MKFETSASRSQKSDDNLIPMINVVFLLLVFFMIAGTLRASDPLTLQPLASATVQPLVKPVHLYVGTGGVLVFDGTPTTLGMLPAALSQVTEKSLADDLVPGVQSPPMVVKADANLSVYDMRSVLSVLRDAGVKRVELVTSLAPVRNATVSP